MIDSNRLAFIDNSSREHTENLPITDVIPESLREIVRKLLDRYHLELQKKKLNQKSFIILADGSVPPYVFVMLSRAIDATPEIKLFDKCVYIAQEFVQQENATVILKADEKLKGPIGMHAVPVQVLEGQVIAFDITQTQPFRSLYADPVNALIIAVQSEQILRRILQDLYGGEWRAMTAVEIESLPRLGPDKKPNNRQ